MKILVVDDESLARDRLQRLLRRIVPEANVLQAADGESALSLTRDERPELLLLDIRMPGMDGLAVASQLRAMDQPPAVVFCTAYDDYALEALRQHASAYLLKPVRERDLREALDSAARLNRVQLAALGDTGPRRTHVNSQGHRGVESLAVADVRCFLAEQKYVCAIHPGGELLLPDTLKELEQEFDSELVRVHRNALVALAHVIGLRRDDTGGWCVELADVTQRPAVSRRHLAEVKRRLQRR